MLKYRGGGFIRGVPARDLKDDEVAKFGIHYLLRSGLYEVVKPAVTEPPDSDQEAPAEQVEEVEQTEAPKRKRRSKKE